MMPSTSVRPAANRNSMMPNCSPFSVWTRTRVVLITPPPRVGSVPGRRSFHRAVLHIVVGEILDDDAVVLLIERALPIPRDDGRVEILDREMVAVEPEGTAH